MLKIGDFSKICQVSIKSLRHWDSLDLLKPAQIDPQSGYRYYTIDQLAQVNRILALKTMGLGLPQIADLLRDDLTPDQIRAMLRLKQAELQQQMEQAAGMLTVIESRLKQIETQGNLPNYEASLKAIPPLTILAIHETIPHMQRLVEVLYETYPYARQKDNCNLLAVFHGESFVEDMIDTEIGFPVEGGQGLHPIPLSEGRTMKVAHLPPVELMACTVHHGKWMTLAEGYIFIGQWIDRNGYQIVGPGREVFHFIDWHNEMKDTVTEIQFPVSRR
ncbi:MAG TPA: MerR family transcriptional regulator [Phototrophicaceae bacterium]|jgi:DNA-binding transcriptional MerR regulator|nr:MerR family transcriptional regulator [Phototrophicaceae bacterium]